MSAFDNVHLPEDIESGALSGPSFDTGLVSLSSGAEQRNANWDQERLVCDISYGIMSKDDDTDIENSFKRILAFFRARLGRQRGFLFKDYADFEAINEPLYPHADRLSVQLTKRYDTYLRRITRPIAQTLILYAAGEPYPSAGATVGGVAMPAWSVAPLGVLAFATALPLDAPDLSCDFLFDVPMRFDSDLVQVALEWQEAGSIPSIKIIQVRE